MPWAVAFVAAAAVLFLWYVQTSNSTAYGIGFATMAVVLMAKTVTARSSETARGDSGQEEATWQRRTHCHNSDGEVDKKMVDWLDPTSAIGRSSGKTAPCALDNTWNEPNPAGFKVRSKQYLTTRVKVPSVGPAIFAPVGVHIFTRGEGQSRLPHLANASKSLSAHLATYRDDFFLAVSWMLPGPPFYTTVFLFQRRTPVGVDPAFDRLFSEFLEGTDEEKQSRFKYLPRLDVVPKLVMSGVRLLGGEKPTMLTRKLTSRFYRGPNYLEVCIDISSSKVANVVAGLIFPKMAEVVVSHAFLLECRDEDELPERVLGCLRTQGMQMLSNTIQVGDCS